MDNKTETSNNTNTSGNTNVDSKTFYTKNDTNESKTDNIFVYTSIFSWN